MSSGWLISAVTSVGITMSCMSASDWSVMPSWSVSIPMLASCGSSRSVGWSVSVGVGTSVGSGMSCGWLISERSASAVMSVISEASAVDTSSFAMMSMALSPVSWPITIVESGTLRMSRAPYPSGCLASSLIPVWFPASSLHVVFPGLLWTREMPLRGSLSGHPARVALAAAARIVLLSFICNVF